MRSWKAVILAIAGVCLAACERSPAENALPGPALWLIEDADTRIWLFGSVHVLPPDLEWRRPAIEAALAEADTLYLETPVDEAAAAQVRRLTRRSGFLPAGQSLDQLLDDSERTTLRRAARNAELDADALQRLRPWLAALQLSLGYATARGQDPASGVEESLVRIAAARDLPVRFLETPEEQVAIFADLPREAELRFLKATMRQVAAGGDVVKEMDELWLAGDVERLGRVLDADFRAAGPAVETALITRRNERWAEALTAMLDEPGEVFVAVGAGHLAGENSLLTMLAERGVAAERR